MLKNIRKLIVNILYSEINYMRIFLIYKLRIHFNGRKHYWSAIYTVKPFIFAVHLILKILKHFVHVKFKGFTVTSKIHTQLLKESFIPDFADRTAGIAAQDHRFQ